jgi:RNA-directed DNA polymerase
MSTQAKFSAVSGMPKQGEETQTDPLGWIWVETSIWTQRMLTALGNGVKGGKWFSMMDKIYHPRALQAAWQKVKRNKGASGVDKISIERFESNAERYLAEIHEALKDNSYSPDAVRRVLIPKGNGATRPLGIPTIKDRIVQTALKMAIEPIFEKEFQPSSYGFRPGLGCKDALREVNRLVNDGYTWVVDADLKSYFDTISHKRLMVQVEKRISDGRVLGLIESFLSQKVMDEMSSWNPITGTPQGGVISPLLANIFLHPFDTYMREQGFQIVRYADDFVVLCKSEGEAEHALKNVREWMSENELTLHPEKTHVGNASTRGEGFDFLGYRFEAGKRWVRSKSMKALRERIRSRTKRNRPGSLVEIVAELNPMLRGWFEYFKHAYKATFPPLDGFIRRRLRSLLRRRLKKHSGTGRAYEDHQLWPNAFFAEIGLFTTTEVYRLLASQSR